MIACGNVVLRYKTTGGTKAPALQSNNHLFKVLVVTT